MAQKSILDLMREGNYSPRRGRPLPMELIYQANTISYEDYQREAERQRRVAQAGRNASLIASDEAAAAALDDRARRAGVPERFLAYAIDLTRIEDLNSGRGIYLCGSQGSHKTTVACSMLRGWLRDNPFGTARFVRSTTLIDELNDTYQTRDPVSLLMGSYAMLGLLVIDDLGKEVATARAVSRLWELLDRRYGANLPTIVTTQHKPGELSRHLGENGESETALAIVSRMRETMALIDMGDADQR